MTEYYVSTTGDDRNTGDALHPFRSIGHAASLVQEGDTAHVAPGLYVGPVLLQNGAGTAARPITFVADIAGSAQITCDAGTDLSQQGYAIWYTIDDYVVIRGFEVYGNTGLDARWGIYNAASYVTIEQCSVHDIALTAFCSSGGAGICCGNPGTTGNRLDANRVYNCGPHQVSSTIHGIYTAHPHASITNALAYNNAGWGIHTWHGSSDDTIANTLCWGNLNGGIIIGNGDVSAPYVLINDNSLVSNNIVIDNGGYGISERGATGTQNRYLNNLVSGNAYGSFSLQNGLASTHSLAGDPRLVNFQASGLGDYHLQAGSPCIDAGTNTGAPPTDYDGVSRPIGPRVDIGPYEFHRGGMHGMGQ